MRKVTKIKSVVAILALAISSLLFSVPSATPVAATTFSYPGIDMGMDMNVTNGGNWLVWDTNRCNYGQRSYNWWAGAANNLIDSMPIYPVYYGSNITSLRNLSYNCNRVWLVSGPWDGPAYRGQVYSQCLRPGQAINRFGFPYDNNVQQIGLSWSVECG